MAAPDIKPSSVLIIKFLFLMFLIGLIFNTTWVIVAEFSLAIFYGIGVLIALYLMAAVLPGLALAVFQRTFDWEKPYVALYLKDLLHRQKKHTGKRYMIPLYMIAFVIIYNRQFFFG